jgi:hypothetical protein
MVTVNILHIPKRPLCRYDNSEPSVKAKGNELLVSSASQRVPAFSRARKGRRCWVDCGVSWVNNSQSETPAHAINESSEITHSSGAMASERTRGVTADLKSVGCEHGKRDSTILTRKLTCSQAAYSFTSDEFRLIHQTANETVSFGLVHFISVSSRRGRAACGRR